MTTRSRVFARPATFAILLLAVLLATIHSPTAVFASDDEWESAVSMPIGRGGAVAVYAGGGKAFIIGGFANALGDTNLNLRMKIQSGIAQYEFKAPAPTARAEMAAANKSGDIYVAGGRSRGGSIPPYSIKLLDTFEVYHSNSDTWETLPPMPTPRAGLGLVVEGDNVYAIGGRVGGQGILKSGNVLNVVEIYDIDAGTWSTGTPMPTPRSDFGIAVMGSSIYVMGGWDGTPNAGDLDTVEKMSTSSGNWSTIDSMPTARTALTVVVEGNDIYALGGHTGIVDPSNELDKADVLDTDDDEWETINPMIGERAQAVSVKLGGDVYVLGGHFYPDVSGSAANGTAVQKYDD